jgi:hypothetical protein
LTSTCGENPRLDERRDQIGKRHSSFRIDNGSATRQHGRPGPAPSALVEQYLPGSPRSIGGTPKASAMSRAAEALSSAKSISAGESAMLCQVSPPSSTIGRPALAPPA